MRTKCFALLLTGIAVLSLSQHSVSQSNDYVCSTSGMLACNRYDCYEQYGSDGGNCTDSNNNPQVFWSFKTIPWTIYICEFSYDDFCGDCLYYDAACYSWFYTDFYCTPADQVCPALIQSFCTCKHATLGG
jgi:hypothetical protein